MNVVRIEVDNELTVLDESRNWPLCGGNKIRKLSYILRNEQFNGLLTFGSKYSSHCLATAYLGAKRGCPVRLLVLDESEPSIDRYPHLALSAKLGAELVFVLTDDAYVRIAEEKDRFADYHWIPGGGHCQAGLIAYKDWFVEVLQRYPELCERDKVLLPYGTGTTALGILAAINEKGLDMQVIGVSVARDHKRCMDAAKEFFDDKALSALHIDDRYSGQYGEFKKNHKRLRADFLKRTGIVPDPVYNIRVIEYMNAERLCNVIMIHTGGQLNNLL